MKCIRGCEITQVGIADDFYEAYKRCFEGKNPHQDEYGRSVSSIVAIPGFVNGLFACELYLKSLINGKKTGHNLKDLFDALDDEKKNELNKTKSDEGIALNDLLKGIGNGFEVWRYCFEDKNKEFEEKQPFLYSEIFLKTYLPVLKDMAHRNDKA